MKKTLITIIVVAVIAVALGSAGLAYAQSPTPTSTTPGSGYGTGMSGRGPRGGMGVGAKGPGVAANGGGILHDAIVAVFAEKLNISVADIEARLASGVTMAQIALSTGLTLDEFRSLMIDARTQAIDQAVKDGTLTQAQADWMKQHGAGQMGNGRGMRGGGAGQFGNPACPYYNQNNP